MDVVLPINHRMMVINRIETGSCNNLDSKEGQDFPRAQQIDVVSKLRTTSDLCGRCAPNASNDSFQMQDLVSSLKDQSLPSFTPQDDPGVIRNLQRFENTTEVVKFLMVLSGDVALSYNLFKVLE